MTIAAVAGAIRQRSGCSYLGRCLGGFPPDGSLLGHLCTGRSGIACTEGIGDCSISSALLLPPCPPACPSAQTAPSFLAGSAWWATLAPGPLSSDSIVLYRVGRCEGRAPLCFCNAAHLQRADCPLGQSLGLRVKGVGSLLWHLPLEDETDDRITQPPSCNRQMATQCYPPCNPPPRGVLWASIADGWC